MVDNNILLINNKFTYFIKRILVTFIFLLSQNNEALYAQSPYQKVTILTAPIGHNSSQYGGPQSVTRSLIAGLSQLGITFNYNPSRIDDVGDVVMVLADLHALRQAISLKKSGRIKKLLAGPNLVVRANEDGGILADPEVDICIVPSYWVKPSYEDDEPSLKNRIQIWYAGVDTYCWFPARTLQQKITDGVKNVLVYWKTEEKVFCKKVENILRANGFNPIRLQYGSYNKEYFKQTLSTALFAVFITRSESQGIAFAESWAMDVPTLVWDPQEPLMIRGKLHWPISACPYLNESNGTLWKNGAELTNLIQNISNELSHFSPRSWVIRHMSDEISAQLICNIINQPPNASTVVPFETGVIR